MKIHEYQAKNILKQYGIPIQDGVVIDSLDVIDGALSHVEDVLGSHQTVIKAQIHAGGRGKGGGVKFAPNHEVAVKNAEAILGMNLVTHQTGPEGRLVRKILVTEALDIKREFYVAITLDRALGRDVFMVSSEGGMEIEEVAKNSPEKIVREVIVPGLGLRSFQARNLVSVLNLPKEAAKETMSLFAKLYKVAGGVVVVVGCSVKRSRLLVGLVASLSQV